MRLYLHLMLLSVLTFMLAGLSLQQTPTVNAETLRVELPRLDGKRIYVAADNGEADRFDRSPDGMSRLAGLLQRLGAEMLTMNWNRDVPADADMVLILGPTTDYTDDQSARLWSYINNDGRVLLLADPIEKRVERDGSLSLVSNRALQSGTGLFNLMWTDLGIRATDTLIVTETEDIVELVPPGDNVRAETPTPTPLPAEEFPVLVSDFVITLSDSDHPVTAGVEQIAFFGARTLEFDGSIQIFDATPLVFTDESFYGESDFATYLDAGVSEYNIGSDTTRGPQGVAAAVVDSVENTRIVLVGDREVALNGYGFQTSPSFSAGFVYPDNVVFVINAIAWLLEVDEGPTADIDFPTPGPTATATITPSPMPSPTPTAEPTEEAEATAEGA